MWAVDSEFRKGLQTMFMALKPLSQAAVLTGRVAIAHMSFLMVGGIVFPAESFISR